MYEWLPSHDRLSYLPGKGVKAFDLGGDIVYREIANAADFAPLTRFVRDGAMRKMSRTRLWRLCASNNGVVIGAFRNKRNMIGCVVGLADAVANELRIYAVHVAAPYHKTNVLPNLLLAVRLELPEYPTVCEVDRADNELQTELPTLGWKLTAGDEDPEATSRREYTAPAIVKLRNRETREESGE